MKKDPGIPNLFPFKDKILEEIEENKRKKAEDGQRLRDAAKANKKTTQTPTDANEAAEGDEILMDQDEDLLEDDKSPKEDDRMNDTNPMAALLASARTRAVNYDHDDLRGDIVTDEDDEEMEDGGTHAPQPATDHRNPDSSRRAFDKIFKQVLEAADVILYVLDARDPDWHKISRSRETHHVCSIWIEEIDTGAE